MTKGKKAEQLFKQGYNCSQSVALAFASELGINEEALAKMMSGFGGGIGRMREVCGCFSGMVFVANILYGYSKPTAYEEKKHLYFRIQELARMYKEQNGSNSLICRELLGLTKGDGNVPQRRTDDYYKKRPCAQLCSIAADIMEEYIKNNPYKI